MSIIAARIDNRLLHGIVATQWYPKIKPQRIMLIDDDSANNPTKKAGFKMAKPVDSALSVITKETALANFAAGKYDNHTVLVIASDPRIMLDLLEAGQTIPQLVVGGTATPPEGASATRISNRAWLTREDALVYQAIIERGTKIVVQYVPADKPVPLSSFLS